MMNHTTLAAQQEAFMTLLLDDSQELPEGLEARRVDIYRNAYRARLVDALRETFPRTARWVGDAAFAQAAAHHVISFPPSSWTLDAVGEGFEQTLATLFANDPEVSELAWLEWAMHLCFVSYDATPLDAAGFTGVTAGFEDDDWANMRLRFMPGTQQANVAHRIDTLWRALAETAADTENTAGDGTKNSSDNEADTGINHGGGTSSSNETLSVDFSSDERLACIVWRQAFTPALLPVSAIEGRALALMLEDAGYGELCEMLVDELGEEAAANDAGAMLGRWLNHGMIVGVSLGG
jgi:hypothetical protein